MKKIFLLLFVTFTFSSCEKDDICDAGTSTTPRLVIEFYDSLIATPTLKNLTDMKAIANGKSDGIVFNSSLAITNPLRFVINSSKIYLPLDPSAPITTYALTNNFGASTANEDVVTFKYTKNKVYVSRACGYKYLFNLTNTNSNILTADSNNWIKNILIVKPNLETENEVHIQIYF
ncbi:DUF6452 family protein [Flavobacterium sp.]|uniref:DUF6452 family protein n=1 Tax=Flavobacterium sp. TaxID=239 RepID=UPI003BD997D8